MERKDLSALLKGIGTLAGIGIAFYVGYCIGNKLGHPRIGGGLGLILSGLFVNGILEQKYDEIRNPQFYSHLRKNE